MIVKPPRLKPDVGRTGETRNTDHTDTGGVEDADVHRFHVQIDPAVVLVKDANALYVTEVWKTEADHKASLQMPDVRALIEKGRPMVAGFGDSTRLVPIGGHGLR